MNILKTLVAIIIMTLVLALDIVNGLGSQALLGLMDPNNASDQQLIILSQTNSDEEISRDEYVLIAKEIKRCRPFQNMTDLNLFFSISSERKQMNAGTDCKHSSKSFNRKQLSKLYNRIFIPIDINKFAHTSPYGPVYKEMLGEILLTGIGEEEAKEIIPKQSYKNPDELHRKLVALQGKEWAKQIERYFVIR